MLGYDFLQMFKSDLYFLKFSNHIVEMIRETGEVHLLKNESFKDIRIDRLPQPAAYFPLYKTDEKHLIFVDTVFLQQNGFKLEEICAVILHEVGHIANYPIEEDFDKFTTYEYYADDYVRMFGFGDALKSSIEKMIRIEKQLYGNTNEYSKAKIKRIQDNVQLLVGRPLIVK